LSFDGWSAGWPDRLRRFGRWWLAEFLALFPDRLAAWLMGGGQMALTVGRDGARITLHLREGRRIIGSESFEAADDMPARIEEFLAARGLSPDRVPVGLRLRREQIFCRTLILPVEAAGALDAVVAQDLVARTPFRLPAIHHAYVAARPSGAGRITVRQSVVRRDLVADAAAWCGLDVERLAFVEPDGDPGAEAPDPGAEVRDTDRQAPAPRIALGRAEAGRMMWTGRVARALACSLVLLALLAGASQYFSQQAALDDLAGQVAAAKARAQQVRAAIGRLEQKQAMLLQLRSQKADRPKLIDVWEEVTKSLPAHSWLSELKLSEAGKDQQIIMTGFSAAATSLVGLIDQSPLFADASLTAPVALDPVEQRERFALQARLRNHEPVRSAAR
jgi:general secretion pathway protein L